MCHTDLDYHVVVEEDVAQFQVTVDDPVIVQVLAALQQLQHVIPGLRFRHRLPAFVQFQQGLQQKYMNCFVFFKRKFKPVITSSHPTHKLI